MIQGMKRRSASVPASALALSLALALPLGAPWSPVAAAETYEGVAHVDDGEAVGGDAQDAKLPAVLKGDTEIEQLTDSYKDAQVQMDAAEAEVARLQGSIDEIDAELPKQQELSDAGIKQRYIMQSNPLAVVEPLLSSQSLDDFLRQIDYLEIVSRANLRALNTLNDMKANAEEARNEQASVRDAAASQLEEALAALSSEQDERAWKQELAQGAAIQQAGELGGEASLGKANENGESDEADAATDDGSGDSDGEASGDTGGKAGGEAGGEGETEDAADLVPVTQDTTAIPDGADWRSDRDDFIAEWAPRIDAYLAGSPLAGQGENFAAAAWKYNVDPRWSPAISNTESSKGAYCIRPHNAWGWGAADSDPYGLASEWGSWDEAIDAHVSGLARGYGYTISITNAQKYCSSWRSWYNNTLAQMARI